MLTPPELLLCIILGIALLLLISNRVRPDWVAMLVLLGLGFGGLLTPDAVFAGFSSSTIITIISLFILTEGLENTGVIQRLANRIRLIGRGSEVRLIALFMGSGALLSLVMNNIAAAAVLLPAAVQVGRDSRVPVSKLLIPLSFGTMVGGMATYFTTANIIMSGLLLDQGQRGLGMIDFLPTGGLIVTLTLLYMVLIGRRLLPHHDGEGQPLTARGISRSLFATYQLDERLWQVTIPPGSRLVNTALSHSRIGEALGVTVLAIRRGGRVLMMPSPIEIINSQDRLLILGRRDRVEPLQEWGAQVEVATESADALALDLTEVIIPPRSNMIGKTLKDVGFRGRFGLTAIALWRTGCSYRTDVGTMALEEGDALLMAGSANRIRELAQDRDYLVLQSSHATQPPAPGRAPAALLIVLATLLLTILSPLPTTLVMWAGATAMIATGCLKLDDAYRAVEWRVIFLIAGIIPVSAAMTQSGLSGRLESLMLDWLTPFSGLSIYVGVYLFTMLLAQVLGGQITPLIVGAVAITSAVSLGLDPRAMAVTVAIACSTAFLTPLSHAVNILMMGPGGYRVGDFTRVGIGMTLLSLIGLVAGLMLFWGVR